MKQIQALIHDEFQQVNTVINEQLNSQVPLVEEIGQYIIDSGGKRLRPMLVLLSCGLFKHLQSDSFRLAAAIEFIHTATLLHDDVVDESEKRRGRDTANFKWGNSASVLVGDFLYARSFELLVSLRNFEIMDNLAGATRIIAEGEVMQLTNIGNPNLSEEQYYQVIYGKTAKLFEAACVCSAHLAQGNQSEQDAMLEYGKQLGLAFQLIDDALDYKGNSETLGKNVGDDLAEGKVTLPLIYCLRTGNEQQKKIIYQAIINEAIEQLPAVLGIMDTLGAIEYTQQQAMIAGKKAKQALHLFADSDYKQALITIVDLAIQRDH